MQLEYRQQRSKKPRQHVRPRPRLETPTISISAGAKPPAVFEMPREHKVHPVSHRKFSNMWCCRISVAMEDTFYIVDANGMVDCFPSFEAAFSAGSQALISIINKRIVVPKKTAPKAPEIVSAIKRYDDPDLLFGFFDGGY